MLSLFIIMAAFPCLKFPCMNALAVNTTMGNFSCNQCGRPFHDVTQSLLHEQDCTSPRYMEDVDVPLTADDIPFSCDDCGKTFPSINSWIRHSQFNCPHTQSQVLPVSAAPNVNPFDVSLPRHDDPNTQSQVLPVSAAPHIIPFDVSLPHDDGVFFCSSHNTSDGSRCSFKATSRRLVEMHMQQANHPFNCPHENCTSTGIAWRFNFHQYNAHVKTPHGDSAKRKKINESHQSTIPATAPLETQRKSANIQTSVDDSEAEEASDEESPDSPRPVDSYHASIEEMVGVRINSTIPTNTDTSLTQIGR